MGQGVLPEAVLPDMQVRGRRDSGENLAIGSPLLPGLDPQLWLELQGTIDWQVKGIKKIEEPISAQNLF